MYSCRMPPLSESAVAVALKGEAWVPRPNPKEELPKVDGRALDEDVEPKPKANEEVV